MYTQHCCPTHRKFTLRSLEFSSRWLHVRFVLDEVAVERISVLASCFSHANHHSTMAPYIFIHHSPLRCAIGQSTQHIITSCVIKFVLHLWTGTGCIHREEISFIALDMISEMKWPSYFAFDTCSVYKCRTQRGGCNASRSRELKINRKHSQ